MNQQVAPNASARARTWLVIAPIVSVSTAASVVAVTVAASRRAQRDDHHRRFDLELDAATAEVRERLRIAEGRERRHALVNAFTAVEGAATILARESIRPSDRSTLTEVLDSGLNRVRGLLAGELAPDHATVSLAEAAALVAKEPPWDETVDVQVPADLVAVASRREIEEALRQVLTYAKWRAPAGPLVVRGRGEGESVLLWVDDHGPHVPARRRRAFLDPDCRLPHHETVTTLHVAIRLVREQGGDFRIEERPGGGASFGIAMPVFRA